MAKGEDVWRAVLVTIEGYFWDTERHPKDSSGGTLLVTVDEAVELSQAIRVIPTLEVAATLFSHMLTQDGLYVSEGAPEMWQQALRGLRQICPSLARENPETRSAVSAAWLQLLQTFLLSSAAEYIRECSQDVRPEEARRRARHSVS